MQVENHSEMLEIKCQCLVYINSILVNNNKKSKFSRLVLSPQQKTLSVFPINQPKQQKITLQLAELRNIHQKFIAQGKMTIQFAQKNQNQGPQENKGFKIKAQVFIEDASSKNLELLIKKITQIKKRIAKEKRISDGNILKPTKILTDKSAQITINQEKTKNSATENMRKKQSLNEKSFQNAINMNFNEREKQTSQFNRKSLIMQAKNQSIIIPKKQQTLNSLIKIKKELDIFEILPGSVIEHIFSFCSLSLSQRLINKKFSTFVLRNIQTLRFKDQVDETTFLKLAKYTVNIYGRLKNVRNIQLVDRYDQPEIIKNRAKSLYFGTWKQISQKNISSLKGLKIHTLQLPYNAKFSFSCLYGLRLKHLQFISSHHVTVANPNAHSQNFLYLMKNMRELQNFIIPFLDSSTINEMASYQSKVKTLKVLKIHTVNINSYEISKNNNHANDWFNFEIYQKLTTLAISKILQDGKIKFGLSFKLAFPPNLQELQIGSFIDKVILKQLPLSIKSLKLIGQNFINYDISDLFLPNLKYLDLSQCPHVNPNCLENMSDLTVYSNWDRQTLHFWSNAYKERNIKLFSYKN